MKKLWLSPHLKSLSPHVANGDKVGQRCSSTYKNQTSRAPPVHRRPQEREREGPWVNLTNIFSPLFAKSAPI